MSCVLSILSHFLVEKVKNQKASSCEWFAGSKLWPVLFQVLQKLKSALIIMHERLKCEAALLLYLHSQNDPYTTYFVSMFPAS